MQDESQCALAVPTRRVFAGAITRRVGLEVTLRREVGGAVMAVALLAASAPLRPADAVDGDWNAARGLPIVDIRLDLHDVFDVENPDEGNRLFAWGNALHARTRDHVVRRELLFAIGERFDPLRAAESERNLRALGIFQDATVSVDTAAGGARIHVVTTDRWTTELRTEISRRGGINRFTLGLEEGNLLGTAIRVGGAVQTSSDVDASTFAWSDPRLLGSRWSGSYGLSTDDLGRAQTGILSRGFFSEAVPWTASAQVDLNRGQRRLFEAGEEVERLYVRENRFEGFAAAHARTPNLDRLGLLVGRQQLDGSFEAEIAVAALTWARLHRRFRTVRDVDRFGVAEDVAAGWTVQLGAGADLQALGAWEDRGFARGDFGWARFLGPHAACGVQLRQQAFLDEGRIENGRFALESYGYWQAPGKRTLAWRAGGAALIREPRTLRFDLGGDDRLRGYEARHLSGTRILYGSLEDRIFTNWRLFMFRFGGIAFADVAAAWDDGETLDHGDVRLGGGIGLRVGNSRSGSSTTGIDLAFGTQSVQFSLTSGSFFRVAQGLVFPDPSPWR